MKLHMLKDWRVHRAGTVVEVMDGMGEMLVHRGYARPAEAAPVPERATKPKPREKRSRERAASRSKR